MVAGGLDSISLVQNDHKNSYRAANPWLVENKPSIYDAMIDTAETVAKRYGVSREYQDEYALQQLAEMQSASVAADVICNYAAIITYEEASRRSVHCGGSRRCGPLAWRRT